MHRFLRIYLDGDIPKRMGSILNNISPRIDFESWVYRREIEDSDYLVEGRYLLFDGDAVCAFTLTAPSLEVS